MKEARDRHKILVSCENEQELKTLFEITKNIDAQFFYFDVIPFYSSKQVEIPSSWRTFRPRFVSKESFFCAFSLCRFLNYALLALQLFFLIAWLRPSGLLVGVPLVFIRLQRLFFFGRFKLVSVLRSVVFADGEVHKTSYLKGLLRRWGVLGYSADLFIGVGDSTGRFLEAFGGGKYIAVGPFDADNCLLAGSPRDLAYPGDFDVMVFIEGAFAWHGDQRAELDQQRCASDIKQYCQRMNKKMLFLSHPRGCGVSESAGLDILTGGLDACVELVRQHNGRVYFVSMLSTMCFELSYLGFAGCFYAPQGFLDRLGGWHALQGNRCFTSLDDIDFSKRHVECASVFALKSRRCVVKTSAQVVQDFLNIKNPLID